MTKKLRVRFVILSMLALIIMQSLIISLCSYTGYKSIANKADEIITEILDAYPDKADVDAKYFVVVFDKFDRISKVDLSSIYSVKRKEAEKYGNAVLHSKKSRGFIDSFRYGIFQENGETIIILMIRGVPIEAHKSNIVSYVIFSAVGLFVMLGLLIAASFWMTRPISRAYEKQKEFVTSASHELKTPLTVINADADILLSEHPDNKWVRDIREQTKLLTNMTHSLISLARLDEQNSSITRIAFSVSDVAEDVAKSFEALAKKENIRYTISVVPNTEYSGDENMIRQLFSILLDNAFKYCAENGAIDFMLQKKSSGVFIAVTNTVGYIDEEQLSRFFNRFYRADSTARAKKTGYGLGLSIADEIVKKHNSKISARADNNGHVILSVILR